MRRLQNQGEQQADAGENGDFGWAAHLDIGKIDLAADFVKARFYRINAEKNQRNAHQYPADGFGFAVEKTRQNAEYQYRHRNRAEADALPGQRQQPDAAGGADVGAEQNGDAACQRNQAGTQKGDGEQRNQRARLQDKGGKHAEQQTFLRRGGGFFHQAFKRAAGGVVQTFFDALHAKQK